MPSSYAAIRRVRTSFLKPRNLTTEFTSSSHGSATGNSFAAAGIRNGVWDTNYKSTSTTVNVQVDTNTSGTELLTKQFKRQPSSSHIPSPASHASSPLLSASPLFTTPSISTPSLSSAPYFSSLTSLSGFSSFASLSPALSFSTKCGPLRIAATRERNVNSLASIGQPVKHNYSTSSTQNGQNAKDVRDVKEAKDTEELKAFESQSQHEHQPASSSSPKEMSPHVSPALSLSLSLVILYIYTINPIQQSTH